MEARWLWSVTVGDIAGTARNTDWSRWHWTRTMWGQCHVSEITEERLWEGAVSAAADHRQREDEMWTGWFAVICLWCVALSDFCLDTDHSAAHLLLCTNLGYISSIIRSTSKSRPNNIRAGKNVRPYVRTSVHKKFLRFQWNLVYR